MCILGKLAGGGSVAVAVVALIKGDMWQVTGET